MKSLTRQFPQFVIAVPIYCMLLVASAAEPRDISFSPNAWATTGDVKFNSFEGFPDGQMVMKSSGEDDHVFAQLKTTQFASGTIEFDVKPDGENWPTIRFHQKGPDDAEEFYIRPGVDCAAQRDCMQYAPILGGRMLWNAYPQYQHAAPFRLNEFNHVKMVISGKRMNVYINRDAAPDLVVGELEGNQGTGTIELQGPATFANLVITPDAVAGLPAAAELDPTLGDAGYVRNWMLAAATVVTEGDAPTSADIPDENATWSRFKAERFGMLNLARLHAPNKHREHPEISWLKTEVMSDRARTVTVNLGVSRRAWLFVNGMLAANVNNLYYVPEEKKYPDGRLSIENATTDIALRKGHNEIVVGVSSNTKDMTDMYAYGVEFRFTNPQGLTLARPAGTLSAPEK